MSRAITPGRFGEPGTGAVVGGDEFESILAVDEYLPTDGHDAVDVRPVAGLVRLDDVLHVLAEARPELGRHELQSFVGHRGEVGGEFDAADVDLVGDHIDELAEALRVRSGDGDRLRREADPSLMRLADRQRGRADLAHEIHRVDELVEGRELVDGRPVGEMDAVRTVASHRLRPAGRSRACPR